MEPPPVFDQAIREVVDRPQTGSHGYMPNAGYMETRSAVAEHLKQTHGVSFGPENVIMTCGAAGALNVAIKALVNPGDEILTFRPYFVEYTFYADNHGAQAVTVPTLGDFSMDLDALEKAVTPKTAAVLINSPNNPTGKVYAKSSSTP